MSIKTTRTGLEQAIVAEGRQLPAMLPGEYAGRLWLRLSGIDPGGAPEPTAEEIDARALESARKVIARRFAGQELGSADLIAEQLGRWRDDLSPRQ